MIYCPRYFFQNLFIGEVGEIAPKLDLDGSKQRLNYADNQALYRRMQYFQLKEIVIFYKSRVSHRNTTNQVSSVAVVELTTERMKKYNQTIPVQLSPATEKQLAFVLL